MQTNTASPGSGQAVQLGCTCPTVDNHNGEGIPFPYEGEPVFWVDSLCPLHGAPTIDYPALQGEGPPAAAGRRHCRARLATRWWYVRTTAVSEGEWPDDFQD